MSRELRIFICSKIASAHFDFFRGDERMAVKSISIRIEEEMLEKLAFVAEYEGRMVSDTDLTAKGKKRRAANGRPYVAHFIYLRRFVRPMAIPSSGSSMPSNSMESTPPYSAFFIISRHCTTGTSPCPMIAPRR